MSKIKYYELKSVGCHIDKTGMTYPTFKNGKPDLSNPTHINDIENEEWFDTLDNNDKYTTIIIKHTMEREC
tara:strand:+ start:330 stop:542 length:213 start_codon:yes stop_codon:yes gene_type:complete